MRNFHWVISGIIIAFLIGNPMIPLRSVAADHSGQPASTGMVIQNAGQYPSDIRYVIPGPQGSLMVTTDGLWLSLAPAGGLDPETLHASAAQGAMLRLAFPGSNPVTRLEAVGRQAANVSYLLGGDPHAWVKNVPVWNSLRIHNIYPGLDLVLDGQGLSGWRWEMHGKTDLSRINLEITGAQNVTRSQNSLELDTAAGKLRLPLPGIESEPEITAPPVTLSGGAFIVSQAYAAAGDHPTIQTGEALVFSTLAGGNQWDLATGIAVDGELAVYLTGRTFSSDFPTTPGSFDLTPDGIDAFVIKLAPDGSTLEYATFLGGDSADLPKAIALENGRATIAGDTFSSDFPGAGSPGDPDFGDAFLAVLSPDGTSLDFSTLIGGTDTDSLHGLALENGSAYLTGSTFSADFPASGYQGNGDAFAVKINPDESFGYAVLLGGSEEDTARAVVVQNGSAYLTGSTWSDGFPEAGLAGADDVFVLKLDESGAVVLGSRVGGSSNDSAGRIAVDTGGLIFAAGESSSADFPWTSGSLSGEQDAFLLRLNANGTLEQAIALGGSAWEEAAGLALDGLGGITVAGSTNSEDFPASSGAIQPGLAGGYDGFAAYFLPDGSGYTLDYATYLGGTRDDLVSSLAQDDQPSIYLTGYTQSDDFPTTNGVLDAGLDGSEDAFAAKLRIGSIPAVSLAVTLNGQSSSLAPGPELTIGSPITWEYHVSNTGEVALVDLFIMDDQQGFVGCDQTSLAPGEAALCSLEGVAEPGPYASSITVFAQPAGGLAQVSATDTSHYTGLEPQAPVYLPLVVVIPD